jgi:hypothetical protein
MHDMENINFSRARKSLKPYVGDVEAAAVPCGLGRAIGNKVHDKIGLHAFIPPPPEFSFCNGMILCPFGDICMSYVGRNFKDDHISKVYRKKNFHVLFNSKFYILFHVQGMVLLSFVCAVTINSTAGWRRIENKGI